MNSETTSFGEFWSLDEDGNKIPGTGVRCIPADRCEEENTLTGGRCIGVAGHDGHHWRYDKLGRYCWWRSDYVCQWDIASGQTPDEHADYVRPKARYAETYVAHTRREPIED